MQMSVPFSKLEFRTGFHARGKIAPRAMCRAPLHVTSATRVSCRIRIFPPVRVRSKPSQHQLPFFS
ncbi:hypothetical protein K438DRAFT_134016 [Mycena galopus ATCC 62051]|nr:hypothetical protein K438DRAFT_134016 [Mycena galopus ATCC 62051]